MSRETKRYMPRENEYRTDALSPSLVIKMSMPVITGNTRDYP
jgi:hypothetical protein